MKSATIKIFKKPSASSNLLNRKVLYQNKNLKIYYQNCLIWVFWGWNLKKTMVIFEINTLQFIKNELLTNAVNFGIGSSFSKCPGLTFSEGQGSSLGPLYKGCRYHKL